MKRVNSLQRFMNTRAPANCRYQPTCYEHAANCYTHAVFVDKLGICSMTLAGAGRRIYLSTLTCPVDVADWVKDSTATLRTLGQIIVVPFELQMSISSRAGSKTALQCSHRSPLSSLNDTEYSDRYKIIELMFYLTMGFSPAFVVASMNNTDGIQELAWGGCIYCLGVVFFKSDGIIPFAHAIWHIFVAMAAAVHYYAIWKYLYRSSSTEIIKDL
ncbi:monocyte to macrophage differentiation factor [Protopterus annectens]|uniref:monocyte to macrophage differentiation factor n=1 Tax=Protopterus annectens TaxID=7888 RepID=UPI001CF9A658|nr:monocyte to macrophage differentiation factor [Protopterus annectens]